MRPQSLDIATKTKINEKSCKKFLTLARESLKSLSPQVNNAARSKGGGNKISNMRTSIKTALINGATIESWFNETSCNWEAFIQGVGSATDPCNREDAIKRVLARAANKPSK